MTTAAVTVMSVLLLTNKEVTNTCCQKQYLAGCIVGARWLL